MASIVVENWEHIDGQDCSESYELSPRNHNLLMSLLDEAQIDDCDDERLTKVMQSLQDELDYADHYALGDLMDCQSSIDESYGQEFPSMEPNDLDLHWMDVEIMPTSPSDGMGVWCMDHHGQGMINGGVNGFGWIKSNFSPLEEEQDLWHGTNATLIE